MNVLQGNERAAAIVNAAALLLAGGGMKDAKQAIKLAYELLDAYVDAELERAKIGLGPGVRRA